MAQTKNLCAQIPLELHNQVCEAREQSGLTTAQYITNLLTEYFKMKENGGNTIICEQVSSSFTSVRQDGEYRARTAIQMLKRMRQEPDFSGNF